MLNKVQRAAEIPATSKWTVASHPGDAMDPNCQARFLARSALRLT
jgi:hypothetical protein